MSTTIWAEGGFIIIKDATHEEQIPLNSFMFNFVGLTDDVRLFAIQAPEQATQVLASLLSFSQDSTN